MDIRERLRNFARVQADQVIPLLAMFVIGLGVHATYQMYKGSDNSRVPATARATRSRIVTC